MKNQYKDLYDLMSESNDDNHKAICNILSVASDNMDELGYKMFEVLLCGHTGKEQQNHYIKDLSNRFEYADNE